MRQAETTPQGETIRITIGRFGQTPMEMALPADSTIEYALEQAGISVGSGNVFVSGQPAQLNNLLDDGDVVNIVTPKQGG